MLLPEFSSRDETGLWGVEDGAVAVHQDHGRGEVEDAGGDNQHVAKKGY